MKRATFILFMLLIPALAHGPAYGVPSEPPNSFMVEFTAGGKMNITANLLIPERRLADFIFRLGLEGMDIGEAERMFETMLARSFEEEKSKLKAYAGYPLNLADIADIEDYDISGRSDGGSYRLRYRMELTSRRYMNQVDPTFSYTEDNGRMTVSMMLHFPYADIPLGKGISTFELAPEAMQYIVVLPYPISNPRQELGDIDGFLSATAYSAAFIIHPDEYTPVVLVCGINRDAFPDPVNRIEVVLRDDRSASINAVMNLDKDDFRRMCSGASVGLVDGMHEIKSQYERLVKSFVPTGVTYELSVETEETPAKLVFRININFDDIAQVNAAECPLEYALVGDWTFITLPVFNIFSPRNLPLCSGALIPPAVYAFSVEMPGRIYRANELRYSGLPFRVEGRKATFYVSPNEWAYVTVSSDSAGIALAS